MIWYMLPVQCKEPRINRLTPLLVVTSPCTRRFLWRADRIQNFKWCHLRFQFGVAFGRVVIERHILKGHTTFEGHRRPQSWTPAPHSKSTSWKGWLPRTKWTAREQRKQWTIRIKTNIHHDHHHQHVHQIFNLNQVSEQQQYQQPTLDIVFTSQTDIVYRKQLHWRSHSALADSDGTRCEPKLAHSSLMMSKIRAAILASISSLDGNHGLFWSRQAYEGMYKCRCDSTTCPCSPSAMDQIQR